MSKLTKLLAKNTLVSEINIQMQNISQQSINKKLPDIETALKLMRLSLEMFRIMQQPININPFSKGGVL